MILSVSFFRRVILVWLFIICVAKTGVFAYSPPEEDSLVRKIDRIMEGYTGEDKPGAVIGIIEDGWLVFKKGYGMADLAFKKNNDPEVAYKIASLSKQFTATAIASLIRQQKMKGTDDIRQYLPLFPQYDKVITINDLLYHTSGIRDYMVLMWLTGKSFEEDFSNEDALEMIYRQRQLNFTTGTRCVYSNSNYVLLTAIVEKVSGTPLTAYAHTTLFAPLEMTRTGFDGYKVSGKVTRAVSYQKQDGAYRPFKNNYHVTGDGGVLTTLADLVKWDRQFYDTTSLADEILVRGKLNNGGPLTYGMGIMTGTYKGEPIQFHPGAFLGYRAELLRFPARKIAIICLGNTAEINPEQITRAIADVYLFHEPLKAPPLLPAADEIQAIAGKYEVAPQVFIDIRFENGQLSGQVTGQPRQALYPEGNCRFRIGDTNDRAVFTSPVNGKMQQLTVIQQERKTIAKRPALVNTEELHRYTGSYYSEEQKVAYVFSLRNGDLYFRAGDSRDEVSAQVLHAYQRVYFGYQNLEQATIDFQVGADGAVAGFVLNSGRVSGIRFIKK